MKTSEKIRQRLIEAGAKFNCNHNISEYIEPKELPKLQAEVEKEMERVLRALVIDTENDHNTGDSKRVVKDVY